MAYELMQRADITSLLRPAMRVVLKPNLVVPSPADNGATTHPEIAEGVIRYLRDNGIADITIAEGAWVGASTKSGFQGCGYQELADRWDVKLVDTKRDPVRKVRVRDMDLSLCRTTLDADFLINLPVLKGHCQTDMTCCLKNLKGCIPDSEKRRFHSMGLHKPIAILASALKPHLHIVDSICGDLTFEEGGNPVQSNRLLLGFDPVLLDSYGAALMGYRPDEIEHLRLAASYGAGRCCDNNTEIVELGAGNRPKVSPQGSRAAKRLGEHIREDSACSACYAALIFALNKAGGRRLGGEKINIGQGFQGKACEGAGVGNCTSGCSRYVPGCPPKAVDIVEFLQRME